MTRFYQKREFAFAIVWIVLYVVLFSAADRLSAELGCAKIITAPFTVAMSVFLFVWIAKNGLIEKYGLGKVTIEYKKYLYFLPLVLIASTNLWRGVTLNMSVLESVLYVISMLGVGFLEEVIFRGFLFKALCRDGVKQAVVISSLTFGIGHIVNLLNGAELFSTLLQLCYAVAVGFLFTIIFLRSKSLIPCILTHSAINSLSAFGVQGSKTLAIIFAAVLTVVSVFYALWIEKRNQP